MIVYVKNDNIQCRQAIEYLHKNNVLMTIVNLSETPLEADRILDWHSRAYCDILCFFNHNGKNFDYFSRKLNLESLSLREAARMLAEDYHLLNLPILDNGEDIVLGFDEQQIKKMIS